MQDNQQKQLIAGRSIKFWLFTGLLLLTTSIILVTVLSNALVKVTYSLADQARSGSVELFAVSKAGAESKLALIGDFALVSRDTKGIMARTPDSETKALVDNLPFIGFAEFNLKLQPQHKVSKVGADTLGCNLVNRNGTYTHGCGSLSNLSQIKRPNNDAWVTEPVTEPAPAYFSRYLSGFLGFSFTAPQLTYVLPGGQSQTLDLPADFAPSSNDRMAVITDTANSKDTGFVVANYSRGTFVYMSSFKTDSTTKQFQRKTTVNLDFDIAICAINQDKLACYYGPSARDHADAEESKAYSKQNPKGQIEIISLSDPSSSQIINLGLSGGIDKLYMSSSSSIYALAEENLFALATSGDSFQSQLISSKITTAGVSGNSVFIAAGEKVFQYNEEDKTSYLRFYSKNITAPDIRVYGDSVIINAFINAPDDNAARAYSHAYQLTNKVLPADEKRKEDHLPYYDVTHVSFMDYDDNRVYVAFKPAFKTLPDGSRRIDTSKSGIQQDYIIKRLKDDGLVDKETTYVFK